MRILLLIFTVAGLNFQLLAQHDDCSNSLLICNKDSLVVDSITSSGNDMHEGIGTCLGEGGGVSYDSYSKWLYWKAKTDGSLTFTIYSKNQTDIDFAVFDLPNGINQCENRKLLRCNASAPPCAFTTGLSLTDIDTVENFNCDVGENGFCKYIDMKKGNYYALFISNFTQNLQGVGIKWGGTGLFEDECSNSVLNNFKNETRLFPNPVETELSIENSNEYNGAVIHFEILNLDQKLCAEFDKLSEKTIKIDVQNLIPGIYFLLSQDKSNYRKMNPFIKY
ncbi:MAG: T9SS type A sorting domain-containing protein [Saprospiraceae bacterium]